MGRCGAEAERLEALSRDLVRVDFREMERSQAFRTELREKVLQASSRIAAERAERHNLFARMKNIGVDPLLGR